MSNKKDTKLDTKEAAKPSELKVHKDFQEFGRIVSENLNEFFDVDFMAAARRREFRRRK